MPPFSTINPCHLSACASAALSQALALCARTDTTGDNVHFLVVEDKCGLVVSQHQLQIFDLLAADQSACAVFFGATNGEFAC